MGGVDQVENTATVKFGNFDEYQLEKLINPLEPVVVDVPDTAKNMNLIIIFLGIVLVGVGATITYKKRLKNSK